MNKCYNECCFVMILFFKFYFLILDYGALSIIIFSLKKRNEGGGSSLESKSKFDIFMMNKSAKLD
jgi:hypothetical protein